MRRVISYLFLAATGFVFVYAGLGLPAFGDAASPASTHLSNQYIEHAYHDTHTPNFVTVMIADYRSFDTLGEAIVVFTAGLACFLLLREERRRRREDTGAGTGEEKRA